MTAEEQSQRFYAYVWPHRAYVLRTARFLAGNPADVEDLAQETLLRAFRKIEQLDLSANPKGWLASILRNLQIDRSRVRAHAPFHNGEDLDTLAAAPPASAPQDPRDLAALLEALSDQALIDALHQLPEDIRWTLLLVDVEQFTYEEAGEIMDVPAGTVKSRAHRGHQMLRRHILDQPLGRSTSVQTRGETS